MSNVRSNAVAPSRAMERPSGSCSVPIQGPVDSRRSRAAASAVNASASSSVLRQRPWSRAASMRSTSRCSSGSFGAQAIHACNRRASWTVGDVRRPAFAKVAGAPIGSDAKRARARSGRPISIQAWIRCARAPRSRSFCRSVKRAVQPSCGRSSAAKACTLMQRVASSTSRPNWPCRKFAMASSHAAPTVCPFSLARSRINATWAVIHTFGRRPPAQ